MMRNNLQKKIGITGGVGAGKSEVLFYLKSHFNCEVLYADDIGNEVKRKGHPCYEKIVRLLGEEILDSDGEIMKPVMAEKIFASPELLKKVNEIIHPAVYDEIMKRMKQAFDKQIPICFIEAALMIEAGYESFLDEIWVVHASKEIRMKRLMDTRGYSKERVEQIFQRQLEEDEFIKHATRVIYNSSSKEELERQINAIMGELLCSQ